MKLPPRESDNEDYSKIASGSRRNDNIGWLRRN
jgi:hypothetical protein